MITKDKTKQYIYVVQALSRKDVMQKAQKVKNDEFYTRYEDVENEMSMYDKSIWKNKIVFCNCDDAVDDDCRNTSAFALYFLRNFKELDWKRDTNMLKIRNMYLL